MEIASWSQLQKTSLWLSHVRMERLSRFTLMKTKASISCPFRADASPFKNNRWPFKSNLTIRCWSKYLETSSTVLDKRPLPKLCRLKKKWWLKLPLIIWQVWLKKLPNKLLLSNKRLCKRDSRWKEESLKWEELRVPQKELSIRSQFALKIKLKRKWNKKCDNCSLQSLKRSLKRLNLKWLRRAA